MSRISDNYVIVVDGERARTAAEALPPLQLPVIGEGKPKSMRDFAESLNQPPRRPGRNKWQRRVR